MLVGWSIINADGVLHNHGSGWKKSRFLRVRFDVCSLWLLLLRAQTFSYSYLSSGQIRVQDLKICRGYKSLWGSNRVPSYSRKQDPGFEGHGHGWEWLLYEYVSAVLKPMKGFTWFYMIEVHRHRFARHARKVPFEKCEHWRKVCERSAKDQIADTPLGPKTQQRMSFAEVDQKSTFAEKP